MAMMMVRDTAARNKIAHSMYKIAEFAQNVKRCFFSLRTVRSVSSFHFVSHGIKLEVKEMNTQSSPQFLSPERHPRTGGRRTIVYPVLSRRARGLSLGINLFPDRKQCTYDCPYCEVPSFSNPGLALKPGEVTDALWKFFADDWPMYSARFELKDISLSGNGEPTLSPFLGEALDAAWGTLQGLAGPCSVAGEVPVVLITNSTGFLRPEVCEMLERFSRRAHLEVWAKLDGGLPYLHRMLSGSEFAYGRIADAIADFALHVPVKLQTMICRDSRSGALLFDTDGYLETLQSLLQRRAKVRAIQLYTVARMPAKPWVAALEDAELQTIARRVRGALPAGIGVECFGRTGYIE